jgi:hypothetical protein
MERDGIGGRMQGAGTMPSTRWNDALHALERYPPRAHSPSWKRMSACVLGPHRSHPTLETVHLSMTGEFPVHPLRLRLCHIARKRPLHMLLVFLAQSPCRLSRWVRRALCWYQHTGFW